MTNHSSSMFCIFIFNNKVENRCIYLELSASPEVFESPQKLGKPIRTLISQFVMASELDKNVPSTVNIDITVKSALSKGI